MDCGARWDQMKARLGLADEADGAEGQGEGGDDLAQDAEGDGDRVASQPLLSDVDKGERADDNG